MELINHNGELIADAVFITPKSVIKDTKHKLGLFLLDGEDGIVVGDVLADSIANKSGFRTNDIIVAAAGKPVKTSGELIAIIQNQTPGYWLPIKIKRNEELKELLARIPPQR